MNIKNKNNPLGIRCYKFLLHLPSVSPKSSSSATCTHLMENGGSKYENPSKGGFEQLVTN